MIQETHISTAASATLLNKSFESHSEKVRFQKTKKAVVTTVAGCGIAGLADGHVLGAKFKSPLDVSVTADGVVYVADGFNSCIRKITGNDVTTFAGNGNANIKDGTGIDARFKIPCRLATDVEGNLYISDAADARIRKITPGSLVSTHAGTNAFGFRDGDASVAQFGQSFGIITDARKNIYIADSQNNRVRKISYDRKVSTVAGPLSKNALNNENRTINFCLLKGIAIDKTENLFVADRSRVYKISRTGIISTFLNISTKRYPDKLSGTIKFSQIEDMVMDEKENIYLSESHRILKITPDGSLSIVAGSTPGYRDGIGESAMFNEPRGLEIDKEGNIYVADSGNNRIRKICFE
jgi:DNA-binding beta-propeller fold protein YncE